MLELSGPGLLGAPGLKSLQLPSMWGVVYSFLFFLILVFSSVRFFFFRVRFFFFRVRFFSHGHELAACPKTIGVSVTPALHFCSAHPKL